MNLGAEPKKIKYLVGLLAVAGIVFWMNSSSDTPTSAPQSSHPAAGEAAAGAQAPVADPTKAAVRRSASGRPAITEFTPKAPAAVDPAKVDPTLRLDLLAKVQSVTMEGGLRNIFAQGAAEPQPEKLDAKIPKVGKVPITQPKPPEASAANAGTPPTPAKPQAPPINLKYFGYSTKRSDGEKKAFFLDGEDIIVAAEGDIIKKQYKIVRIGVNSVQVEDTTSKSTQTLPLQAAPA